MVSYIFKTLIFSQVVNFKLQRTVEPFVSA